MTKTTTTRLTITICNNNDDDDDGCRGTTTTTTTARVAHTYTNLPLVALAAHAKTRAVPRGAAIPAAQGCVCVCAKAKGNM